MINKLKFFFKKSEIFNFNVVNRDVWVAAQAQSLAAGSRVLDAGSGSCPYRDSFSHCEYKTQDFTSLNDEQLSGGKYGKIDYVCDITSIPVADASFDAILCSEVLEHVPEPIRVVGEFARIIKPGGRIIVTAPLGSGIHQEPYHFYGGYSPFWYEKFLAEAGFDNIIVEANEGSIRGCAQESLRFARLTNPCALDMPMLAKIVWLPFWLIVAPVMALFVPVAAYVLRRFDKNMFFTIGYHVTATRSGVPKQE
ncbi:MAG: methyltransferase domain-containing protein [Mariprofundaceae bacterium]